MSESLTDELLAAYERDIDTDVGILGEGRDQFRLRRLIQEVRRLRKRGGAVAFAAVELRAEKAEAEVERLREFAKEGWTERDRLSADRDRYKVALERIRDGKVEGTFYDPGSDYTDAIEAVAIAALLGPQEKQSQH